MKFSGGGQGLMQGAKFSNIIGLDDFGGLQTLYIAWLESHTRQFKEAPLTVNRGAHAPLDELQIAIETAGARVLSPRLLKAESRGFARFLTKVFGRNNHLRNILKADNPDCLLLWNALPDNTIVRSAPKVVVYDHGLSWIRAASPKNKKRMHQADKYLAVSKAAEAMLRMRWGVTGDVTVISNPIRFPDAHVPVGAEVPGPVRLGAAGRLVSFKGFASAIHALAELKKRGVDATLAVAGDGPEKRHLQLLAQRLGLENAVLFRGMVYDMPSFYGGLDVFICPSLREPFGLVSLEASFYGLPTILANVDGLPETIAHPGSAILIDPTVSLKEYLAMGSSAEKMPEVVYHPTTSSIAAPLALDPRQIADAVEAIMSQRTSFKENAAKARDQILEHRSIDAFALQVAGALTGKSRVHAPESLIA